MPRGVVNGPCRPRFAIMPASGTRTAAENRALAQCRSAGGNCQVKVWTCNSTPGTLLPIAPLEPPYDGLYFGPAPR
jgi:hypothetical protein